MGPLHNQVLQGFNDVFSWYDGPIYLVYILNTHSVIADDVKPFSVAPLAAEEALSRELAVPGPASPGSMDPFRIPNMILMARGIHALGRGLLTEDANIRGEVRGIFGLYKSMIYTEALTKLVKSTVHRMRPNHSDSRSFFSGHTSATFAASSYLDREIDDALLQWSALDDFPLLRNTLRGGKFAVLYGWASYVGYSRMRDNQHYLMDVLIGAAVGTLIGNLVYDSVQGEESSYLPDIGIRTGINGPQVYFQVAL